MNVLIVEDNPISATVLEHTLDKHGYDTITAHDGKQALTCLESHPEIDLVITDIVMPNSDGVELVRRIKERDEWNDIPILVCTSLQPESANHRLAGPRVEISFQANHSFHSDSKSERGLCAKTANPARP